MDLEADSLTIKPPLWGLEGSRRGDAAGRVGGGGGTMISTLAARGGHEEGRGLQRGEGGGVVIVRWQCYWCF